LLVASTKKEITTLIIPHLANSRSFVQENEPRREFEVGWYIVYALSERRLAYYLHRVAVIKVFDLLTGGAFIIFAGLITTARN
jgi:hypothetical protein